MLLYALERSAEFSARLDAYMPQYPSQLENKIAAFDVRMRTLEDLILREMNRLTSERLFLDLSRKRRVA